MAALQTTLSCHGVILTQPRNWHSAFSVNNARFLPGSSCEHRLVSVEENCDPCGRRTLLRSDDNLSYRLDQNPPYNTVLAVKVSRPRVWVTP